MYVSMYYVHVCVYCVYRYHSVVYELQILNRQKRVFCFFYFSRNIIIQLKIMLLIPRFILLKVKWVAKLAENDTRYGGVPKTMSETKQMFIDQRLLLYHNFIIIVQNILSILVHCPITTSHLNKLLNCLSNTIKRTSIQFNSNYKHKKCLKQKMSTYTN